jgi:tetratricopeptide (TPR) repeat protein
MGRPDNEQLLSSYLLAYLTSEKFMDLDSPELPESPTMLNILGYALCQRFEQSNNLADLERAISVLEQAIQKSPIASKMWLGSVNNLGNALHISYEHTRDEKLLDRAIQLFGQVIEHTPLDSP